ncbi:TPA: NADP(H)-dependent aldo-keto reductase [Pseudomonas aeruginosa]|uniref:NADP(H)-dependent aldo-keto reductase n=1 Tax=Pseudomonas aeruginosa TaxID=287 RepID=UPI000EB331D3|nr:NADP(H)-dependent aldo-keto reductase [Pseudomonas aeruginosa]ELW3043041.1 NADP(H)-dependent aldo-keto reductase [Pseudomonas aeruginosa]MCO2324974.1 NADP(H)-dependent aldo-keto reductase [Pseudomonas aeruginosa]HBO1696494.1 NADP(H)-dependent aldo-keto reductase [Pseudomonas aeruginosa]HBO2025140.1 NADP(H)-dependent aldo-keto reductase [Pseudomonas aeruginosa]HBP1887896.1 NADP(H)-dependent aldo-keto reductase [Pseudomonas aeruginosa]
MEYRPLGRTDLKVSALCLGTMTWGEQNSEQDAFAQIARAKAAGINFMDTAEMYPVPPRAETYASTERIIGNWFRRSGDRADWILASKIAGPGNGISHVRDGNLKFNRQHIVAALDASLERLQTDWLDLYQLHWPERRTNFFGQLGYQHQEESFTPLEETLEVLDEQVRAGKIRHIGLSNETPWGTMTFLRLAEERGWPRAVSIQNPYNLLNRSFEVGLAEIAIREQCGLLAYSPMAFGMLSGKYADGARPDNARISLYSRFTRYTNPQAEAACARYVALAREHGLEPPQMALAYVTSRPFVTSNIIGATSLEQLETNLGSVDLRLDEEVLAGIDAIHREQPNPAP